MELHFDEIPKLELETILHQRCGIAPSYAKRLVAVMSDLQVKINHCGREVTHIDSTCQIWGWGNRYIINYVSTSDAA